jgi:hypothetical protein
MTLLLCKLLGGLTTWFPKHGRFMLTGFVSVVKCEIIFDMADAVSAVRVCALDKTLLRLLVFICLLS